MSQTMTNENSTEWLDTAVETVETEAEIAEVTRERRADIIKHILDETEAILIMLESTWAGNEYLGDWYDMWFVHADFETEKAIHITEGVNAMYPGSHLSRAARSASNKRTKREKKRAFDWERARDDDDHCYLHDEFCPKSKIVNAIRTPKREDHFVFASGEQRTGTLDEADLRIRDTRMYESKTGYRDEKFVVEGETYEAFKECRLSDALPFSDVTDEDGTIIEHGCYQTYDGENQLIGKDGLGTFIEYANEAGFTVAVHADYAEYVTPDA